MKKIQNIAFPQIVKHRVNHVTQKFHFYIPKRIENVCPQKNMYTNVIAALFIIAKRYKQSKCPSVDK